MGAGNRPLTPTGHIWEMDSQQILELLERQLPLVEWVVLACCLAVEPAIGCGNYEQTVVREKSCHFIEHLLLVLHVLDNLERHNGTKGSILKARQIERRAYAKFEIRAAIVELAVLNRPLVDIHADHTCSRSGENGGAKSLAAAEIENVAPLDHARRPHVTVEVL